MYNSNLDFIFGSKGEFLGIVSFVEVIEILLVLLLVNTKPIIPDMKLKRTSRLIIAYISISFAFSIIYYYKLDLLLSNDGTYFTIVRRSLKFALFLYLFILLSRNFNRKSIYVVVDKAIVGFALFYSFTTIIYFPLLEMGIDMAYTFETDTRNPGIFIGGDANTLAATLAMCFGYFIAQIEKGRPRKIYYIATIFIILGIIETGSRGGTIGFVSILFLFMYRNSNTKHIGATIAVLFIGFVTIFYFGDKLVDRFLVEKVYSHKMDYDPNKYGGMNIRFYKWIVYLEELKKNPSYLIFGAIEPRPSWINFNVHNVFIVILYYGGVVFLTLYTAVIYKIFVFKESFRRGSFKLIYIFIPFFIMIMELNDWFYFILPILILQSYGYIESDNMKKTPINNN